MKQKKKIFFEEKKFSLVWLVTSSTYSKIKTNDRKSRRLLCLMLFEGVVDLAQLKFLRAKSAKKMKLNT